jgi:hypothetical protein
MLWNTDMIPVTIDLMKWFWIIQITDRCKQLIWSHAEQTIVLITAVFKVLPEIAWILSFFSVCTGLKKIFRVVAKKK